MKSRDYHLICDLGNIELVFLIEPNFNLIHSDQGTCQRVKIRDIKGEEGGTCILFQ